MTDMTLAATPARPVATRGPVTPRSEILRLVLNRTVLWIVFLTMTVVSVYPLIWLFLNSLKTSSELFSATWALPESPQWQNFATAWNYGIQGYLINSVIVTVSVVVIEVMLAALASYALVAMQFRGKAMVYMLILGGAILPPEVSLFPLFKVMAATGLYNTYFALILPNIAFGLPFTTFLVRAYMVTVPPELKEAAIMDGASDFTIFCHVYLPLCRPILASAALISGMRVWNEFIFALTFVESDAVKTITIGVMSFAVALRADWAVLMAGLAISVLPILATFLLMQRQFIGGLTAGAVK